MLQMPISSIKSPAELENATNSGDTGLILSAIVANYSFYLSIVSYGGLPPLSVLFSRIASRMKIRTDCLNNFYLPSNS